jgi:small subunit ribosomal protein S4e
MKRHLKRLASPSTWKIARKSTKWMMRHNPTHSFEQSASLNFILKELTNISKTTKESKIIANTQQVLVDGKRKKDISHSCGLMDIISIPLIKEHFRVLLDDKGNITALKISEAEAKIKPVKLTKKTILKGGKLQLGFSDGRSALSDKKDYKMGDTLVISLPEQKIQEHIPFEKKSVVYLIGGNHAGKVGEVIDFKNENVILKTKDGMQFETLKKYALALGKAKACIKLIEHEQHHEKH